MIVRTLLIACLLGLASASVRRCFECSSQRDCEFGEGRNIECNSHNSCYSIMFNGKVIQKGCTRQCSDIEHKSQLHMCNTCIGDYCNGAGNYRNHDQSEEDDFLDAVMLDEDESMSSELEKDEYFGGSSIRRHRKRNIGGGVQPHYNPPVSHSGGIGGGVQPAYGGGGIGGGVQVGSSHGGIGSGVQASHSGGGIGGGVQPGHSGIGRGVQVGGYNSGYNGYGTSGGNGGHGGHNSGHGHHHRKRNIGGGVQHGSSHGVGSGVYNNGHGGMGHNGNPNERDRVNIQSGHHSGGGVGSGVYNNGGYNQNHNAGGNHGHHHRKRNIGGGVQPQYNNNNGGVGSGVYNNDQTYGSPNYGGGIGGGVAPNGGYGGIGGGVNPTYDNHNRNGGQQYHGIGTGVRPFNGVSSLALSLSALLSLLLLLA